ncbi:dystrotelin-like [Adelges cooleyi]|uniref:dystrotelin-like n=1 Tax=Adelges cooleyi TaxID=133065 RepID=UPI00217F2653|nr:dystrotelin-like [Adelges cooleyi]XP_050441855.1 dystrotelin-like [Adelges cooleyi]
MSELTADEFSRMLAAINDYNNIKYKQYRVAFKLNVIQKFTNLDRVPLYILNGVYEQHKGNEQNLIDKSTLEDIISDVFFAVKRDNPDLKMNEETSTLSLVKILGQIFSKYSTKKINLRSALTVITCLLCDRLRSRLGYLFQINCVKLGFTKDCLKYLLRDLSLLLSFLCENNVFESISIDSVVDACFSKFHNPITIDEGQFMQWFMTEPPVLEWLQIFYRLKMAENVDHNVSCKVCKSSVIGLRYFCLKCVNYNQCQKCFLVGATNKKHKLKHAMQEYCWLETPQQLYTQYLKSFLGRLFGLTSKMKYLPVDTPCEEIGEPNQNGVWARESSSSLDSATVKSPRQELQSVISQIERENRLLEIKVNTLKRGDSQFEVFLNQHRSKIERQLTRLKHLKNHLSGTFSRGKMKRMQSTPLLLSRPAGVDHHKETIAVANLSPIYSDATGGSSSALAPSNCISALSTLYAEKLGGEFTVKSDVNEFSHWLGPKRAVNMYDDQMLNGTYVEQPKLPETRAHISGNKENVDEQQRTGSGSLSRCTEPAADVLSDIVNKQQTCANKIAITVNKQSSVWLNGSAEDPDSRAAQEDIMDDKDMEKLHTELDKILDELQKLVT